MKTMKLGEDVLIHKVIRDCPICNNTHELQYRKRISNAIVKGEKIETEEFYFLCTVTEDEENEFVSSKMMDENLLRAKDAYRKKRLKKGLICRDKVKICESRVKNEATKINNYMSNGFQCGRDAE